MITLKILQLICWDISAQVWHWFQNRRYAHRAKASRAPETSNISPSTQDGSSIVTNMTQAPHSKPLPQGDSIRPFG